MTADEIAYAGGVYKQSAPMWYHTNSTYNSITGTSDWWLLSTYKWYGSTPYVYLVLHSNSKNTLGSVSISGLYSAHQVTSLKSCVQRKSENESAESPYEIIENGG